MALSQVQCLDNNHVNLRTNESKPEFLYSEEQRLALEALLCDGREAFFKYLQDRGLRGFLSDPELETLAGAVEPLNDPDTDTELLPENGEEGDCEPRLSLQYWPDLSDTSVPQMDLGWPDTKAYRGVTRATVYTQPPLEGQAHIKEIVRRTIAQAQKVIAVVMDVFTDVDIFRDLLDAGFKRKVSVYILLERTRLPHFLSMCQRANMHAGYLKHLRVRCAEGAEFCSRSCAKVKGQLGHRFMFIDGDKAVSGSYSFTWMASRLDRNLITVVTGQAVDGFDQLFRFLYLTSSFVDLRQVTTEPEPEPEPVPQPAAVAPPSAADVRKLHNPKYALVTAGNLISSAARNGTKDAEVLDGKKSSKGNVQEAPTLHPGLIDLEKVSLITYLPTWPEPDPPSDVIGFINIRDSSKPTQVHLQRSEMFETSQAIRFSSPFSMPKQAPPAVAQPRPLTAAHEDTNKPQSPPNETKAVEPAVDGNRPVEHTAEPSDVKTKEEAPEQSLATSVQDSEPRKDTNKTLNTESERHLDMTAKQNPDHNSGATSHVGEHTLSQSSSSNSSTPNASNSSHATPTVNASSPAPLSPSGSIPEKETETSLNGQTKPAVTRTDSRTRPLPIRPHSSPEMTLIVQTVHSHIPTASASPVQPQSVSPPSLSEKDNTAISDSSTTPVPPLIPSTTPDPSHPASSSLTMIAPTPKPRTVQLVIRNDGTSDGQKLPEVSVVKRPESRDVDAANVVQTRPEKETQVSTGVKPGGLKYTGNAQGTTHQHQNGTSQETKDDETVGTAVSPAATKPQGQSDVLTIDAPKAHGDNNPEHCLMSSDIKTPSKTDMDDVATVQTDTNASDETLIGNNQEVIPKEKDENKSLMSSDSKTDMDDVATVQTDTEALDKTLIGNNQEVIPNKEAENKSLMSSDSKTDMDCVTTAQTNTEALDKTLIGNNQDVIPNEKAENKSLMSSDFKTPSKTDMDYVATVQTNTEALDKTLIGNNEEMIPKEKAENKSLMASDSKTDMDDVATVQTDTEALDKTLIGNNQEVIPNKEAENKSLMSSDIKTPSKTDMDCVATVQTNTEALDKTLIGNNEEIIPKEKAENKRLMSSDSKTDMDDVATVQTDTKALDKIIIGNNQEVIPNKEAENKSLMSSDSKTDMDDVATVQTDTEALDKTLIGNNQEVIPEEKDENKNVMSSDIKAPSKTHMDDVATVQTDTKALDKTLIENNQEVIPKEKAENKRLMASDSKTDMDDVATVQTDTEALDKTLIGCGFPQEPNAKSEPVLRCKTYHARAHEPQMISYSELNSVALDVDSRNHAARVNSRSSNDGGGQRGSPSVTPARHATDDEPNVEGHVGVNAQGSQKIPKAQGERPRRLHLNTHVSELHSPSSPPLRTPTPDYFSPRTPTADFRTLTPDMSDGYASPMESSTLSTTSEEYYECVDSPTHDPVFHHVDYPYHGPTVGGDGVAYTTYASECRSPSSLEELDVGLMAITDHFKEDLTETTVNNNNKKTQTQVARRKPGSPRVDDGGVISTDGEKLVDEAAVRPSSAESRVRVQSSRDTQGQQYPTGQPHTASPSRSPRSPPSRPRPPQVSHSKESVVSRQAPVANSRSSRARHLPTQQSCPNARASVPRSNAEPQKSQLGRRSPNREAAAAAQEEGKSPFAFTFSKLYNLKGLKSKMSQPQGRKHSSSSSSSPAK